MGLRARLGWFFVAITVVPVILAVVGISIQIERRVADRSELALDAERRTVVGALQSRADRVDDLVGEVDDQGAAEALAAGDPAQATALLEDLTTDRIEGRADVVALIASDGSVLAHRGSAGLAQSIGANVVIGEPAPGAITALRESRGIDPDDASEESLGWVAAGVSLETMLTASSVGSTSGALLLGGDGRIIAATGDLPDDLTADLTVVGDVAVVATRAVVSAGDASVEPLELVVWTAQPRSNPWLIALITVPLLVVAGGLGWLLAGTVVRPVDGAVRAARAIAEGDLDAEVPAQGPAEMSRLGASLNDLRIQLRTRLAEIEQSRDQLRQSVSRLGQTLSSSLDLDRTLAVAAETARDAHDATGAVVWLLDETGRTLSARAAVGVAVGRTLAMGSGLAGRAAAEVQTMRTPGDTAAHVAEGIGACAVAVPMIGRNRVMGVLSVVRDGDVDFSEADVASVRSFGAQTAVAVENVLLHEDTQRLSMTDVLTGVPNVRHFREQAERELAASKRYGQPLSLVILDLDRFKIVNDRHGHQVGDEVLIEVARRLQGATRTPDLVARYGGEEFVVLLPGTDSEGARTFAERLRDAIRSSPIPASWGGGPAGEQLSITASFGTATHPGDGQDLSSMLRTADGALYQAKALGRDCVVVAGDVDLAALPGDRPSLRWPTPDSDERQPLARTDQTTDP